MADSMIPSPIPSWFIVLVVIRKEDRFLLVRDREPNSGWYVPAGRLELGDSFEESAVRFTFEETLLSIRLDGILRIEHTPYRDMTRLRVIFVGEAVGDTTQEGSAGDDLREAAWFTLEQIRELPQLYPDLYAMLAYAATSPRLYPLHLLRLEQAPWG